MIGKYFVSVAIVAGLVFLLAGCQENKPVPARQLTTQEQSQSAVLNGENQTLFMDEELTRQIRLVGDYQVNRNDIGMLVIALQLQTIGDKDVAIDAKCKFVDKNGKTEETPWQPTVIRRREIVPLTFTSLSPEVTKYNVYVRFSK